ncbi:MAG: hypothetical protein VZQ29_11875, partial [Succiniclasticum sp.]|nr:hypothetical protein [Succiniclasticum sp.]
QGLTKKRFYPTRSVTNLWKQGFVFLLPEKAKTRKEKIPDRVGIDHSDRINMSSGTFSITINNKQYKNNTKKSQYLKRRLKRRRSVLTGSH